MKLIRNEGVVLQENYYGCRHREYILLGWLKFIQQHEGDFFIQYSPIVQEYKKEVILTEKEKAMKPMDLWQKELLDELIEAKLSAKEIARKTKLSLYSVYARMKSINGTVYEAKISGNKTKELVRPLSQYSNHNNISQYFD